MRLLLAATQSDLRLSLELMLSEQAGVEIVGSASEGESLSALIFTAKPDVVVADWDLAGQRMPDILNEAKELPHCPKFLILIARDNDYQTAVNAGADVVIVKGSPPKLLLSTIQNIRSQPQIGVQ